MRQQRRIGGFRASVTTAPPWPPAVVAKLAAM